MYTGQCTATMNEFRANVRALPINSENLTWLRPQLGREAQVEDLQEKTEIISSSGMMLGSNNPRSIWRPVLVARLKILNSNFFQLLRAQLWLAWNTKTILLNSLIS